MKLRCSILAPLTVALFLGVGCSLLSPKKDPTRFYELTATTNRPTAALKTAGPTWVVNLEVAGYLENNSLVQRIAPNQLSYFPFDQWANPFTLGLNQVLRADLAATTGSPIVNAKDSYVIHDAIQLRVQIQRFDVLPNQQVQLTASWQIRSGAQGEQLHQGQFSQQHPFTTSAKSLQSAVAAFSELVAELSQSIVATAP